MYDSDCCRSMMWMPLRSVRMKRLTFGFQRRVWCPKCTPLSSSWRMVTTAMVVSLFWRSRAVEVDVADPGTGIPGARRTPALSEEGPVGVDAATAVAMGTRSHPDFEVLVQCTGSGCIRMERRPQSSYTCRADSAVLHGCRHRVSPARSAAARMGRWIPLRMLTRGAEF